MLISIEHLEIIFSNLLNFDNKTLVYKEHVFDL